MSCILTVDDASAHGVSVRCVVDGSTCQVACLCVVQVPLVARVQHTVGVGRPRPNRKQIVCYTCTVAVDIVQAWALNTVIQHIFIYC